MNTFQKIINHFKTVCIHKWYVLKYCFKAKLYWQGLVHDLSKFNPVEFFESVKYYNGTHSPIDDCKKDKGYSNAWFHHRGHNKHHYEYWCDNFDNGVTCVDMPYKYAVEMLCDYIGAGQAYFGKEFTFKKELEWWVKKKRPVAKMSKYTKLYIDKCFHKLAELEQKQLSINTTGARKYAVDEFWDFKLYEQYYCEMMESELQEMTSRLINSKKAKKEKPTEQKPKTMKKPKKVDNSDANDATETSIK